MNDFIFDLNNLEILITLKKEVKIFNYLLELSQSIMNDSEKNIKFFDITNLELEELRKVPDGIILINEENKIKFLNNEVLCLFYSQSILNLHAHSNIVEFVTLLRNLRRETRLSNHEDDKPVCACVIFLYHYVMGHDICDEFIRTFNHDHGNEHRLLYFPFVEALKYLQINSTSLSDFLHYSEIQHKGVIVATDAHYSVEQFCELQPESGRSLLKEILACKDSETLTFVPDIFKGLSRVLGLTVIYAETMTLYDKSDQHLKAMALFALGNFDYEKSEEKKLLTETLKLYDYISTQVDITLINVVIQASSFLLRYDNSPIDWICKFSHIKDNDVQFHIANFLNKNSGSYRHEKWFQSCLLELSDVGYEYTGTIQFITFTLHSIMEIDPNFIIIFFYEWIQNHELEQRKDDTKQFTKVFLHEIMELYRLHKDILQEFITDSFNSNDPRFHFVATNVISELGTYGDKDIELSKSYLDRKTLNDIGYIITKILGFVYGYEQLCMLVFSALRCDELNEDIYNYIKRQFTNYIGYNFPDYTISFLKENVVNFNERQRQFSIDVLEILEKREEEAKTLIRLKEFETPKSRKFSYLSLKNLQDKEMMDKAQESSIFLKFVNKTILKGGKTSFTKYEGEYTSKMKLQEHRVSMYIPQGELKDPIGQAIYRYNCVNFRRKEK